MWEGLNRRKFPRADFPCKIVIFKKGERKKLSGHTENIGAGGVCVILKKGLDKFSLVDLSLYLKKDESPIECEGRAMWVVKRESEFDTGIEFINLKNPDRIKIERIVEECLKKEQTSSQE